MKNKKALFTTKWIAYTAMLTALVVATNFIPAATIVGGNIYWVDGMVLIAAFLVDPLAAFIAGGVGSFLYDVIWSPSMMLPSLVIHGLQGIIVSVLVHYVVPKLFSKKLEPLGAGIAALIGAVEVVLGYFIYRCITRGVSVAVLSILRNVIQEIIGITIAMIICYATTFKKQLEKNHLLPDFKKEILDERKKVTEPASKTPEPTENIPEPADEVTENESTSVE